MTIEESMAKLVQTEIVLARKEHEVLVLREIVGLLLPFADEETGDQVEEMLESIDEGKLLEGGGR